MTYAIITGEHQVAIIEHDCDGAYQRKITIGRIQYTCCGFVIPEEHTFMGDGDGNYCPHCGVAIEFTRKVERL